MLVVVLGIFVVFLIGLYSSSIKTLETNSISIDESLESGNTSATNDSKLPLTPIVITTTTPIEVGNGNLLPTSVNTFEVLSVENFDDHLDLELGYFSQDLLSKSIRASIFNNVNFFDEENERTQISPNNLFHYISVGDRLSVDFFSNSNSKPVDKDQLTSFFNESGLHTSAAVGSLAPVEIEKLTSLLDMGDAVIEHTEFRIITIRKIKT
jgi:hypothetical protein